MDTPRDHREQRDRPHTGANFLVDIGGADPRSSAGGFSEVVFPAFPAEPAVAGDSPRPDAAAAVGAAPGRRLLLRRGVTGSLDLYRWWNETRDAASPPTRTVTVQLLADDRRAVVLTWRFDRAYPVSLSYSPLRAMDGVVLVETVELAFERVEMA